MYIFILYNQATNAVKCLDSVCVLQLQEPILLLGKEKFAGVDIRVRVRGGGHVAQVYGM